MDMVQHWSSLLLDVRFILSLTSITKALCAFGDGKTKYETWQTQAAQYSLSNTLILLYSMSIYSNVMIF